VCRCLANTKYKSTDDSCEACENLCTICEHDGCKGCKANSTRTDASSPCICIDGYYNNNGTCDACNPACATCTTGPGECLNTCKLNAEKDASSNNCVCIKSYVLSSANNDATCNYKCPDSCTACSEADGHKCTVCAENYTFWPEVNGCYKDCPSGYVKTLVDQLGGGTREECTVATTDRFEALFN